MSETQTQVNDGGPAFPRDDMSNLVPNQIAEQHPGMTLRDYFAAKAIGALIAETQTYGEDAEYRGVWGGGSLNEENIEGVALAAYAIADAMLKAREGR